MKVLIQRVRRASVRVEGATVGAIENGLLVYLGVEVGDSAEDARTYADRTAELRVFPDERLPLNRSLRGAGGACLVVSQFTLAADTRRGNRPSLSRAAEPETARALYERYCERLREQGIAVETGRFREHMEVESINDGPVTLLLDPKGRAEPGA